MIKTKKLISGYKKVESGYKEMLEATPDPLELTPKGKSLVESLTLFRKELGYLINQYLIYIEED